MFIEFWGQLSQRLLIYLASMPLFILMSAGSLEYYAALYNPSEQSLNDFLDRLAFPFTLNDTNPRNVALANLTKVNRRKGSITRIFFAILPILQIVVNVIDLIRYIGNAAIVINNSIWTIIFIITVIIFWRFGNRLGRSGGQGN